MAAPAIRSLKHGRPDLHLTIVAQKKLAALWKALPEVDEVIELPPNTSPWKVANFLKGLAASPELPPFDAALLLPNSLRSALEVWLAGIPRRIGRVGKKGRARRWFINQPFPENQPSRSTEAAKGFVAPVLGASSMIYTLNFCAPSLLALHQPQRL